MQNVKFKYLNLFKKPGIKKEATKKGTKKPSAAGDAGPAVIQEAEISEDQAVDKCTDILGEAVVKVKMKTDNWI